MITIPIPATEPMILLKNNKRLITNILWKETDLNFGIGKVLGYAWSDWMNNDKDAYIINYMAVNNLYQHIPLFTAI